MGIFESIVIGISIAAIPGIIFFEIIRRTLTKGFWSGILLSIGEFIGNFAILLLVYLGLSKFLNYNITNLVLYIVGSLILGYVSYCEFKITKKDIDDSYKQKLKNDNSSVLVGLGIAVTNPVAIALWISIVGSYISEFSKAFAIVNLFFIAFGLVIFYFFMVLVINYTKKKIPTKYILYLSKIFGLILAVYSLSFLYKFVRLLL